MSQVNKVGEDSFICESKVKKNISPKLSYGEICEKMAEWVSLDPYHSTSITFTIQDSQNVSQYIGVIKNCIESIEGILNDKEEKE
jgi:hypothetical protein